MGCWSAGGAEAALRRVHVLDAAPSHDQHGDRWEAGALATYLITHEVDDVDHWWSSSKRDEVFGPLGITTRTFRDPEGSNRVGLIAEIPDVDAFNEFTQSDAAAVAIRHDGVPAETLLVLASS